LVGQCILLGHGDDHVSLAFVVGGPGIPLVEGEDLLPIERAPSRVDPKRVYFRCPQCNCRTATIVLKAQWKCRTCHELVYRRQLIPRNVAAAEALQALDARVGGGRPVGMHHTTYLEMLNQLDRLRTQADGTMPPEASLAHRRAISASWVGQSELPDGLWMRGYTMRDGAPVKMPDGYLD
jgi:hypothetical protein